MLHLYCKLLQLQQVFGFVILGSWQVYYLTVVHSGVGYIIWICFFNDWENMIPVESLISQKNKNVLIWVWQIWWVKLDLSLFLSFWTSVACVKLKFIALTCTPFYKSHIGVSMKLTTGCCCRWFLIRKLVRMINQRSLQVWVFHHCKTKMTFFLQNQRARLQKRIWNHHLGALSQFICLMCPSISRLGLTRGFCGMHSHLL